MSLPEWMGMIWFQGNNNQRPSPPRSPQSKSGCLLVVISARRRDDSVWIVLSAQPINPRSLNHNFRSSCCANAGWSWQWSQPVVFLLPHRHSAVVPALNVCALINGDSSIRGETNHHLVFKSMIVPTNLPRTGQQRRTRVQRVLTISTL